MDRLRTDTYTRCAMTEALGGRRDLHLRGSPVSRRRSLAIRGSEKDVIFGEFQDWSVRGRSQRPVPIILRLVCTSTLGRQPCGLVKETAQGEIYDRPATGLQTQMLPRNGEEERCAGANSIQPRQKLRHQIAALKIGKGGNSNRGVRRKDLDQCSHLGHTLGVPNYARDYRLMVRSETPPRHPKQECQKNEFNPKSLHYVQPGEYRPHTKMAHESVPVTPFPHPVFPLRRRNDIQRGNPERKRDSTQSTTKGAVSAICCLEIPSLILMVTWYLPGWRLASGMLFSSVT